MRLAPALATLILAATSSAQTTWYVDDDGVPPGTGTQNDPYTSIDYAVAQATTVDGDTLAILPGTYVEAIDMRSKSLRLDLNPASAAWCVAGPAAQRARP